MNSDNVEQVILEVDGSPVAAATAQANAALDNYGKKAADSAGKAGKAFEDHGGLVVRTSDRTRNSLERLVQSSEKLAQSYGKTGVERLVAQRDQLIQRLGAEEKGIARVTTAYATMIAQQKKMDGVAASVLSPQGPGGMSIRAVRDIAEGRI